MIKSLALALMFGVYAFASSVKLTGDHICHRQENYTETVNVTTNEPIQIRKNFWCIEKIRCSELQPEMKEVVHVENVTKTRTVDFCCPDYEETEVNDKKFCKPLCPEKCINGYCENPGKCECKIGFMGENCELKCPSNRYGNMCSKYCKCGDVKCNPETGECLKSGEKIETTTTVKPNINGTIKPEPNLKSSTTWDVNATTEHNPYDNYKGEYGKDYNHYVKMGLNESSVQESIDKIVDMEAKKANEEMRQNDVEDFGYILVDVSGNEIQEQLEPLKHPQYVSDHHAVSHHEESIAMVTVGCLILGMLVFLLAMVYIRRITRRIPASRDIDPEADLQKAQKPYKLEPSKIVHQPLPIPPLRPSLRKHKSVTFDESIDEVDVMNRKRAKSLSDVYDIPRSQKSMKENCTHADAVKVTPEDFAVYSISKKLSYNTFPRKTVSRRQSLEHIYDEIPFPPETTVEIKPKTEQNDEQKPTDALYGNQESIEKTKL